MLFHERRLNEMGPGVSLPAVHPVCLLPGWCCAGGSRQGCVAYEAGSLCSLQAATVLLRTCADLYYCFDPYWIAFMHDSASCHGSCHLCESWNGQIPQSGNLFCCPASICLCLGLNVLSFSTCEYKVLGMKYSEAEMERIKKLLQRN